MGGGWYGWCQVGVLSVTGRTLWIQRWGGIFRGWPGRGQATLRQRGDDGQCSRHIPVSWVSCPWSGDPINISGRVGATVRRSPLRQYWKWWTVFPSPPCLGSRHVPVSSPLSAVWPTFKLTTSLHCATSYLSHNIWRKSIKGMFIDFISINHILYYNIWT